MDTVIIEADGWRMLLYQEGGFDLHRFDSDCGKWFLTRRNPPAEFARLAMTVRREAFPGIVNPDLTADDVMV